MFNKYLLKNLPAEFIYGGHAVRKGITSQTTTTESGRVIYDAFLYTYVDECMSFFILMEDGSFKCVEEKINVLPSTNAGLASRHLERGNYVETSKYGDYDKNKVVGVYGAQKINDLMKKISEKSKEDKEKDISYNILIGEKSAYTGLEVGTILSEYNNRLGRKKRALVVPAIKKDENDEYESKFGVEEDFQEFLKDKDPEQVVEELIAMNDEMDALGNKVYESLGM
jgi:hypothetical protein